MESDCSKIIFTPNPATSVVEVDGDTELVRNDLDRIGIAEIRWLTAEAHRRPQEGYSNKLIAVSGTTITSEAQQAALKILEEPPAGVRIVLLFPVGTQIIATIASRVVFETRTVTEKTDVFTNWLAEDIATRIATVETKAKAKDTNWMQGIKSELQQYVATEKELTATQKAELLLVMNHLLTRGASNKMLLEHAALNLPLTH